MTKLPLRVDYENKISVAAAMMGGKLSSPSQDSCRGVALDSRTIEAGDLFFAIPAVRDGHEFVESAFEKGASASVVERDCKGKGPFIRVDSTFKALRAFALSARRSWGKGIVGISGSNGKTTTKEMTSALLNAWKPTLKAPGTWNNYLGVPLTLLMLRKEHEGAVLELGINDFGEMSMLTDMAEPTIAVLTSIGPVHLEKLQSVEGVAKAKGELFDAVSSSGVAVVNLDDRWIAELGEKHKGEKITVSTDRSKKADVVATIRKDRRTEGYDLDLEFGGKRLEIQMPFVGQHNVSNFACACGAALAFGVPADRLQEGITAAQKPEMRLETIRLSENIQVINDCYNANPSSMSVALDVVSSCAPKRKIAVLGDMLELGEFSARAHRDIGVRVARLRYDHLFVIGQFARDVAQGAIQGGMESSRMNVGTDRSEFGERVAESLEAGDTVLVKGSRGMKMEEFTTVIEKKWRGKS